MPTNGGVTGLVLAGGRSTRLGRSKALEPFLGGPMLTRVASRLGAVTSQVTFVLDAADTAALLPIPPKAHVVIDEFPGSGPLGAIYTGLKASSTPWVLVVACDLPFLDPKLLSCILGHRNTHDAVCPIVGSLPEPAHAAYSKQCLPAMLLRLQSQRLKLAGVLQDLNVAYLSEKSLRQVDPHLLSFFNVNTQADLDRALALARSQKPNRNICQRDGRLKPPARWRGATTAR